MNGGRYAAMERFRGRSDELGLLQRIYDSEGMRTCAVLGRRRIGKSFILEKFCSQRRSVYVEFVDSSESTNVELLDAAMAPLTGGMSGVRSFKEALNVLRDICFAEKTVVVFDEFPYLTQNCKSASSLLQNFIDTCIVQSKSMFVICGSSITVMRDETSKSTRPLYGRFPSRLEVKEMSFDECRDFNPGLADEDALMLYMTLGGIPMYHEMATGSDYPECIKSLFFGPHPLIQDEASAIIGRELNPAARYNAVMDAIRGGATILTDIANRSDIDPSSCLKCLRKLMAIGVVGKVHPMLDAPKGPTYEITDNMIAFEFEVLRKYGTSIRMADPDMVYEELSDVIRSFLGKRFEGICADFMRSHYVCKEIGRWWGKAGVGTGTDIDLVAVVRSRKMTVTVLGECKFRGDASGFEVYNSLKSKADALSRDRTVRLMLFSASGFKDNLVLFAEENGIILVDLDTLISRKPAPEILPI